MEMIISDIVDRYTINQIKIKKGNKSFVKINKQFEKEFKKYDGIQSYIKILKYINEKIWNNEKEIRSLNLPTKNISLDLIGKKAITVRKFNDWRNDVKNEIIKKYNQGITDKKIDYIKTLD